MTMTTGSSNMGTDQKHIKKFCRTFSNIRYHNQKLIPISCYMPCKVPTRCFSRIKDKAKTQGNSPSLNVVAKPTSIPVLFHFWHSCEHRSSKATPIYFIGVKKQVFQLMVISVQDKPSLSFLKSFLFCVFWANLEIYAIETQIYKTSKGG